MVSDNNQKAGKLNSPMPPQAVDAVGRKLKARYDEMLQEPIPDKLMQLLDKLDHTPAKEGEDAPDTADRGEE